MALLGAGLSAPAGGGASPFRSVSSGTQASGAIYNFPLPTTKQAGDLILVWVVYDASGFNGLVTPIGWTQVAIRTASVQCGAVLFSKVSDGTETTVGLTQTASTFLEAHSVVTVGSKTVEANNTNISTAANSINSVSLTSGGADRTRVDFWSAYTATTVTLPAAQTAATTPTSRAAVGYRTVGSGATGLETAGFSTSPSSGVTIGALLA